MKKSIVQEVVSWFLLSSIYFLLLILCYERHWCASSSGYSSCSSLEPLDAEPNSFQCFGVARVFGLRFHACARCVRVGFFFSPELKSARMWPMMMMMRAAAGGDVLGPGETRRDHPPTRFVRPLRVCPLGFWVLPRQRICCFLGFLRTHFSIIILKHSLLLKF